MLCHCSDSSIHQDKTHDLLACNDFINQVLTLDWNLRNLLFMPVKGEADHEKTDRMDKEIINQGILAPFCSRKACNV